MNIFKLRKAFYAITASFMLFLTACSNEPAGPTFTIKGTISGADGKTLRITNLGIESELPMDSMELDATGMYEFTLPQPECFDFYLLELGNEAVLVTVDSTETIIINGNTDDFSASYTVEGSHESLKIKEINTLRDALKEQIITMSQSTSPAVMRTRRDIIKLIEEFKENLVKQYIASAPGSASSYYILSLSFNGAPLFSPMTDRKDSKYLAAVATNLQFRYPEAKRSLQLAELAKKAMSATSPAKEYDIEVKESSITTTGLFDINLPTIYDDSIKLSSLKGKAVLLDFTVYQDPNISSRNIKLREIYAKYKEKGFEIYQISFDSNKHFWQTSANNLPWICVRDDQGAASSNALLYNVQQLPTFFLINKDNEIVLRDNQITDLENEIKKLLK